MFALVSPDKTQLPPGAVVRLIASWQEYQHLCDQRGDGSIARIKYRNGEVLLMSPLPVQGQDANLLADVVKVLLDHDGREYDAFTPLTISLPKESGIEPDYCFYIDNWQAVSGKKRIDWQQDPPPDLVIEIDVTSYSNVQDYLPYRVPEVWLFKNQQLLIHQLQGDDYQLQTNSCYFPNFNLLSAIARCVQIAYERNTSAAIRDLKQRLNNPIGLGLPSQVVQVLEIVKEQKVTFYKSVDEIPLNSKNAQNQLSKYYFSYMNEHPEFHADQEAGRIKFLKEGIRPGKLATWLAAEGNLNKAILWLAKKNYTPAKSTKASEFESKSPLVGETN